MQRRKDGIIRLTPAADYTDKEGYGVTIAGSTATISTSGSTPWDGVILEGGTTTQGVVVGILGSTPGAADVKISGTVTRGDKLTQSTDGTAITDAGSGTRVQIGIANEDGVSGDLIDTFLRTPRSLS